MLASLPMLTPFCGNWEERACRRYLTFCPLSKGNYDRCCLVCNCCHLSFMKHDGLVATCCCNLFSTVHTRTHRYMWYQNSITLFDCMLEESFDFKLSHLAFQRNMFHLTTFEYRFDVTLCCCCCYTHCCCCCSLLFIAIHGSVRLASALRGFRH
jgi:hypothetical protein